MSVLIKLVSNYKISCFLELTDLLDRCKQHISVVIAYVMIKRSQPFSIAMFVFIVGYIFSFLYII